MTETLISSSALILIICGIRILWKEKINVHLQYALWLLVAIRLLPFGFLDTVTFKLESPISIMQTVNHLSSALNHYDQTSDTQNNTLKNLTQNIPDIIPDHTVEAKNQEAVNYSSTSKPQETLINILTLKTFFTTIWIIGMVLCTLWILYVNIRFHRTLKRNRVLLENVNCQLPVYVSDSIHSPLLFMVNGRFGIYVTKNCVEDEVKMKHAITHELCHYKHFDYLWSLVRCFILIIYWFHPLVWLAARLSKLDCELSCDAAAIKILGDEERYLYGRTILGFAAVKNNESNLLNIATGLSERKSDMKIRIQQISKKSKMMLRTGLEICTAVVLAIVVTFTTAPHKETKAADFNAVKTTDVKTYISKDTSKGLLTPNESLTDGIRVKSKTSSGRKEDTSKDDYYYDGEQFITPDGPIKDLSGFTDDIIINHRFGMSTVDCEYTKIKNGSKLSFKKLDGIYISTQMDATEDATVTINYSTTADSETLKTVVVLPDNTIVELKNSEDNTISLPKGTSFIDIVAYKASGKVTLKFKKIPDTVETRRCF